MRRLTKKGEKYKKYKYNTFKKLFIQAYRAVSIKSEPKNNMKLVAVARL